MNYEDDLKIDETALDIEWLDQPTLMFKYGKLLAYARMEADLSKENLNLVKAELDKDIRTNPEMYAIDKITEAAIQNTILTQSKYKKAYQRYIDASFEVNILQSAVSAVDQRKTALENMVRLHGQQYFAGPRIPRDLSEMRQEKQIIANKAIKIKKENIVSNDEVITPLVRRIKKV